MSDARMQQAGVVTLRLPKSDMGAILVHPPTPERVESPSDELDGAAIGGLLGLATDAIQATPAAPAPAPATVAPPVAPSPARTVSATADSLQLAARRGRRPRLFGFSDESPSSSSTNSPDRPPPRRMPQRKASETNLHPATVLAAPKRRENGLKLNLEGIVAQLEEVDDELVRSPYSGQLIRKKSGEIVKSALKFAGPLLPNGTPRTERPQAKSCPSTPSFNKSVQFDAKLEHVKLFLQDQKPQVVSRDGSPTYTTSDGDEYPFPSTDEEREGSKVLSIRLPNFSTPTPSADLYLESVTLDDDRKTLRGVVDVRNMSFQKWVAVRFTFDWWQTTSEVTATYSESIRSGTYDRFTFAIKLHDLLARIEEKTLFFCIRYDTDGREIWDSNNGDNYQVLFEKTVLIAPLVSRMMPRRAVSGGAGRRQWASLEPDRLADLRAKLSNLEVDDDESPRITSPRRPSLATVHSPINSPRRALSTEGDLPAAGQGLAARYDFGSALRSSARRVSPNTQKADLPEVQTGLLYPGQRQAPTHAATEFYSPRAAALALSPDNVFTSPLSPGPLSPGLVSPASPIGDVTPRASAATRSSLPAPAVASPPSVSPSIANDSPPMLVKSGSDTTLSESPNLSPEMGNRRWQPPAQDEPFNRAVELLCWADSSHAHTYSSPLSLDRRSHSTSSLDQYFVDGFTTPRALARTQQQAAASSAKTPSSIASSPGSFHTPRSYASTPTREDMDQVESDIDAAVRSLASSLASTPLEGSPVLGIRRAQPSAVC